MRWVGVVTALSIGCATTPTPPTALVKGESRVEELPLTATAQELPPGLGPDRGLLAKFEIALSAAIVTSEVAAANSVFNGKL